MRRLTAIAASRAVILALCAPSAGAQERERGRDRAEQQERRGERGERGERHPQIRAAMHALMNAERRLEHAAHDYGGHRAKALELVKQAEQELKAAIEFARSQEKTGGGPPPANR
jgi:hypothetical protein